MTDSKRVRLRRLPDARLLLWSRSVYEVEVEQVSGETNRIVTSTPHRVLSDLTGMNHPADLSALTSQADLAWDGHIGMWRGDAPLPPADPAALPPARPTESEWAGARKRAEKAISRHSADQLPAALALVGSLVGSAQAGEQTQELLRRVMIAQTPSARAEVGAGVIRWCQETRQNWVPSPGSSLTEQAIVCLLLDRLPMMTNF